MSKQKILALVVLVVFLFPAGVQAGDGPLDPPPELLGTWYGGWEFPSVGLTGNFAMTFSQSPNYGLLATMYATSFGLIYQPLPATVEEGPDGVVITIEVPGVAQIQGVLDGQSLHGTFLYYGYSGTWYAAHDPGLDLLPGAAPGPACNDLPPLYCTGDAAYCSELVHFEPDLGMGYTDLDPPGSPGDRPFSYIRRDLMMVIQYATAKVACKTAVWDYGNFAPLELLDMSEWDGSTPHYPDGSLAHPRGTHEGGKDIDTAYYQLYAADNLWRAVGMHHDPVDFTNQYHLVGPPYALDKWRTALYVAYLSEHPRMRLIGVDGQVGLVLEGAIQDLVELGWLDADARASMPLAYDVEYDQYGLFYFHHNHMHLSIEPLRDIVSTAELGPQTLNRSSRGRTVTSHIEFAEGVDVAHIDEGSVKLLISPQSELYAQAGDVRISDYNGNGIADLTVKFDRQQMLASIEDGFVELSITGLIDGEYFKASDTVFVRGTRP